MKTGRKSKITIELGSCLDSTVRVGPVTTVKLGRLLNVAGDAAAADGDAGGGELMGDVKFAAALPGLLAILGKTSWE